MLKEQVAGILEKYFNDPIEIPCPYCEANKEILNLFKAVVDKLTVIDDEAIDQIRYKGQFYGGAYNEVKKLTAQAQLQHTKNELDLMGE